MLGKIANSDSWAAQSKYINMTQELNKETRNGWPEVCRQNKDIYEIARVDRKKNTCIDALIEHD